jgi:very-short-patch-repair endonuclease
MNLRQRRKERGINQISMVIKYNKNLKPYSQKLRNNMTDSEIALWSRLRKKQICNIQFYRQKTIGNYIVDFYAPALKLVIEIDGDQHYELPNKIADEKRDAFLRAQGLHILRFDSAQTLRELDNVVDHIYRYAIEVLRD